MWSKPSLSPNPNSTLRGEVPCWSSHPQCGSAARGEELRRKTSRALRNLLDNCRVRPLAEPPAWIKQLLCPTWCRMPHPGVQRRRFYGIIGMLRHPEKKPIASITERARGSGNERGAHARVSPPTLRPFSAVLPPLPPSSSFSLISSLPSHISLFLLCLLFSPLVQGDQAVTQGNRVL